MNIKILFASLILLLAGLFLSGCTDAERRGYSRIPQNSPAAWEQSTYYN